MGLTIALHKKGILEFWRGRQPLRWISEYTLFTRKTHIECLTIHQIECVQIVRTKFKKAIGIWRGHSSAVNKHNRLIWFVSSFAYNITWHLRATFYWFNGLTNISNTRWTNNNKLIPDIMNRFDMCSATLHCRPFDIFLKSSIYKNILFISCFPKRIFI